MAITTLAGAVAGLQPPQQFSKTFGSSNTAARMWSSWPTPGMPNPGAQSVSLAGAILNAPQVGQFAFNDPPSGNAYLGRMQMSAFQTQLATNVCAWVMLADRLWSNGGIDATSTSPQTINSPTWPARDINGSTDGEGVFLGLEQSAINSGSVAQIVTCNYTNSAGAAVTGVASVGGQGSNIIPITAVVSTQNSFYPLGLAPGDLGVRSVQSIQFASSWVTGTFNLVAYRPIAILEHGMAMYASKAIDAFTGGLPRLFNGSVPWILWRAAGFNNNVQMSGEVQFTQG
jgi:hypothetical protein